MKAKLTTLTVLALFAATGSTAAFAHEPTEAGSAHWLEHAEKRTSTGVGMPAGANVPEPAEAGSTAWLANIGQAAPAQLRGAAGPIRTESTDTTYVPEPAEAGSANWLGRIR